jgi:hypothetical protein
MHWMIWCSNPAQGNNRFLSSLPFFPKGEATGAQISPHANVLVINKWSSISTPLHTFMALAGQLFKPILT